MTGGQTPNFRTMASMATEKLILKPLLFRYFFESRYPDEWTVTFRKEVERKPDGFFHPSSHPTMTARQLYYYLTQPDRWQPEQFDYGIKMSMLMGSALHDFVQMALEHLGLLVRPSGRCPACRRRQPSECSEPGFLHAETATRGHGDGILKWDDGVLGFELKSANPFSLSKISDNDVEAFKVKWPYYYAQIQEYMRLSGIRKYLVLFFGMGNPWDMTEFLIDFDPVFAHGVEVKYRQALAAVETGRVPPVCCAPRSAMANACPATSCEIKRA